MATQEYARRFQNQPPNVAGPGAYQWLSRGLLEAFVAFLGRAGAGWEVHGACYEFQWPEALAAVREAHRRGAKVHVIFDDMGPSKPNRAAIESAKIRSLCRGRVHGKLMHNKFFVADGKRVWTGSTNITETCLLFNPNNAVWVESAAVAKNYLAEPELAGLQHVPRDGAVTEGAGGAGRAGRDEAWAKIVRWHSLIHKGHSPSQ